MPHVIADVEDETLVVELAADEGQREVLQGVQTGEHSTEGQGRQDGDAADGAQPGERA
jgi:hypothetical protein